MSTTVAYCLLDGSGEILAGEDENHAFYAASTMKLAVMVAVARAVDRRELAWATPVTVKRVFHSQMQGAGDFMIEADDRDDRLPADGETMPLHQVTDAMITRSSNEATNMLMELVGIPACAEVMDRSAAKGCHLERYIGDLAARAFGVSNQVTPYGLTRLLQRIVTGQLASPEATQEMVEMLSRQEFPVIAQVLPEGVAWGSKSGWVEGIEHDAAFIGHPDSPDLKLLAVCTEGFEGREGQVPIKEIAGRVL